MSSKSASGGNKSNVSVRYSIKRAAFFVGWQRNYSQFFQGIYSATPSLVLRSFALSLFSVAIFEQNSTFVSFIEFCFFYVLKTFLTDLKILFFLFRLLFELLSILLQLTLANKNNIQSKSKPANNFF